METIHISLEPSPEQRILKDKAQAALAEFVKGKPGGPFPRTVWMGEGYIELMVFNNRLHLAAIFVQPDLRGNKLASRYLTELLEVADKHGAEIECSVKPFGAQVPETMMGVRELTKWYRSKGFQPVQRRKNFLLRPASPSQ
jgi:ribosomal protein S18 acetylase RimI-like enzyme